ncbi:MAG: twin-arginine translocation signal domain-containing protein [Candidatus Micrarchaeota archaeon]
MAKVLENRQIAADERKCVGRRDFLKFGAAGLAALGTALYSAEGSAIETTPRGGARVVGIDVERLSGDIRRLKFTARVSGGEQKKLYYCWFAYADLGGKLMLLNPAHWEAGQPRFVGQVLRNVNTTDGDRGDFVVRVRPTGLPPSKGPQWEPIVEKDGRVKSANAFYKVAPGSVEPVADGRLERNSALVCRERASAVHIVPEYAPMTPAVLLRQH